MKVKRLAVIIKSSNGKCYQAVVSKQQEALVHGLLAQINDGSIPVYEKELDMDLLPNKEEQENYMRYQVTKKQCQDEIDKLGHVCDYCGRDLKPIKTVDNSGQPTYWKGCMHNQNMGNFTWGVKKETYDLAVKLVLEDRIGFSMNHRDRELGDFDYAFEKAVRRACSVIADIEYMKNNEPRYTKEQLKNLYFPNKEVGE